MSKLIGTADAAGTIITAEMVEAAEMFVDEVVERIGSDALEYAHVEERVTMHNLVHPVNEGTPDVWSIAGGNVMRTIPSAEIEVLDFKYGHRFVDAYENWQGIDYTAGVLERNGAHGGGSGILAGVDWNAIKVRITIVQPRCYGHGEQVRHWEVTAEQLRPYFAQLKERAYQSMGPGAPTIVGPECRDCKGRHACVSLLRAVEGCMETAGLAVPIELPSEAQAVELRYLHRAADLLKSRITGLEAEAMANIRKGVAVPGFTLKQGEGRLAWTKPAADVFALGDMFALDLRKEPDAITPTQAIKAGKAVGLTEELVLSFAARPKGETKLVEVDSDAARKVFGK